MGRGEDQRRKSATSTCARSYTNVTFHDAMATRSYGADGVSEEDDVTTHAPYFLSMHVDQCFNQCASHLFVFVNHLFPSYNMCVHV